MSKYENHEAFVLSAKRVMSRIKRAKDLKVDKLDNDGLNELVESLSLAKAIETEQELSKVKKGQEYYVQTLIDSLKMSTSELVDLEYKSATFELGSEDEILATIEALKAA